jgi:hypothetical protein
MEFNKISMKKNLLHFAFTIFAISLFSSCAIHDGYMVNSASLSSNNFTFVKRDASGTTTATYILGIGGLSRQSLVDVAKKNLLMVYPLKDNQTLVNLTVNWKDTYVLPFAITKRCTVTADIVEFK